jgi:hypothetical protein
MSSLSMADRRILERFLGMSGGYVLDFSDQTLGEFVLEAVGLDIHAEKYGTGGTSKANKLRTLWRLEPDQIVGKLLLGLIEYNASINDRRDADEEALAEKSRQIAAHLFASRLSLDPLMEHARIRNADHLAEQVRRLQASVDTDPSLAIGTAKELIETCCKTILEERGKSLSGSPEVSTLIKETLRELKLVPEGVPETARGADVVKRLLNNLGTIGNCMAELRGLYGTGHGRTGRAAGLSARHARLAVSAASALVVFLFDTHTETKP